MIKRIFTYGIGELISKSLPFLLLPFMTHYLSSEEYGYVVLYLSLLSLLLVIVGVCTHGAVNVFGYKLDKAEHAKLITACFHIMIVSLSLILLLAMVFFGLDIYTVSIDPIWFYLIVLAAFFQAVILINLTLYRVYSKPVDFVRFQILFSLVTVFLSVILILYFISGWQGRIIATLLSILCFSLYSINSLYKLKLINIKTINKTMICKVIRYAFPLTIYGLTSWCRTSIDKVLLFALSTSAVVGVYGVHFQLSSITLIIFMVINQAIQPEMYKILSSKSVERNKKVIKLIFVQALLVLTISIVFLLAIPYIFDLIISEKFEISYEIFLLLIGGFCLQGIIFPFLNILLFHEKTKFVSVTGVLISLLHVTIGFVLIPSYGANGAAIMNFSSATILLGFVLFGCLYFDEIRSDFKREI